MTQVLQTDPCSLNPIAVKSRFRQRGVAKVSFYAWQHHRKSVQEIHVGTQFVNKGQGPIIICSDHGP